MSVENNEDDPIMRIWESRRDEAKKDAELLLEIQKKQLKSQTEIMEARITGEEARQKKIRNAWSK